MKYEYAPITQRPRLRWPHGKRVALLITFNLETWDLTKDTDAPYYAGGPPILPDTLPGRVPDFPNYSWREYGQRVGIWRQFELFDELGVTPGCTLNAVTCERRLPMVQAAMDRGCELIAHNYEQGELLTDFSGDEAREREVIHRTLEIYERIVGRKARGWLSSSLRGTLATPGILAEAGLLFYCDLMNDDQPYLLHTPHGGHRSHQQGPCHPSVDHSRFLTCIPMQPHPWVRPCRISSLRVDYLFRQGLSRAARPIVSFGPGRIFRLTVAYHGPPVTLTVYLFSSAWPLPGSRSSMMTVPSRQPTRLNVASTLIWYPE